MKTPTKFYVLALGLSLLLTKNQAQRIDYSANGYVSKQGDNTIAYHDNRSIDKATNTNKGENFSSSAGFIQNQGQYFNRNWRRNSSIEFAYSHNPFYIFFTKRGITYRIDKTWKNPDWKHGTSLEGKRSVQSVLVHVDWVGANDDVEIIPTGKQAAYHSFAIENRSTGEITNPNRVPGYDKILYKNLYDNIDVEYVIHPEGGVKYNVILHPGANPDDIQLVYSHAQTSNLTGHVDIRLTEGGAMNIETPLGEIIEHAPVSYYHSGKSIESNYVFENNLLKFRLVGYDPALGAVIDPWSISPNFTTSTAVWEVETDAAGNIYAIGGETPMSLKKYTSAGALVWTYNTPWDTASLWLGTLATDAAGNSYVTSGVEANMHKVNNAGAFVWATSPSGGLEFASEWWSITFNCDQTKLIVGGTWVNGIITFDYYAGIFEINTATGTVINDATVDYTNIAGFGATPVEVRSICSSKNAKYIFLTHQDVGSLPNNLSLCPSNSVNFQVPNQRVLSYKCENYLPQTQNGGGLKALIANDNYFYTHSGNQLRQWDVNTGALINTVTIPGGNATNSFPSGVYVHNSGLAVDDCGNIYAGSINQVHKYDQNLNLLQTAAVGFTVYDVSVNSNGEVVACGAQQNNASVNRNGRIESVALSTCSQYALVCCDASVCPPSALCDTDGPLALTTATAGGTWTISPATAAFNTSTGTFSPSVSGNGTWTVTYTLTCGSESVDITVNTCSALSVCTEAGGDLTVSGGTGPYNWEYWDPGSTTPITTSAQCIACGYSWTFGTCLNGIFPVTDCVTPAGWVFFASGTTVTPPGGATQIQVTDNAGTVYTFDPTTLSPCSASCDPTITPAGPFCQTAGTTTLSAAESGGTWSATCGACINASTGVFNPATAGPGTYTITYSLPCGSSDTETIIVNATDNATFSYSSAAYCTTDADPTPTITGLSGGTFTISPSGTINSSSGIIDLSAIGAGSFVVTYTTNGTCPNSSTFNITISSAFNATITAAGPFCATDAAVQLVAASAGGTWTASCGACITTGGMFDPGLATVGANTITYTISGSCGATDTETITVNAADNASFSYGSGAYCLTDPNPLPTVTGTGGGSFSISGTGSINSTTGEVDITGSGTGTYTVTYTTSGSCPDTETFSITINNSFDATVTAAGPFCASDAAVQLVAASAGGTWTASCGACITAGGMFDPGLATVGANTITYTISGSCGATDTETITVNAADNASFSYASGAYCLTDPNPLPTVTGTGGGSFSISGTGSINSTTGEVDITGSGAGTYTVTYTTSGSCPDTETFSITINSSFDATITAAGPFCATAAAVQLVAASAGGTWTASCGACITAGGMFDPGLATVGANTITYTISGSCGATDTETITVNAADNASFSYASGAYCLTDPNPLPTITGTAGGSFSISGTGSINSASGQINLAASGAGTFTVTYTTSGACPATATFSITISNAFNATISAAGPFCENDAAVQLVAVSSGGTWTASCGACITAGGMFDPALATVGANTITYTISGSCGATDTETITVNAVDDASFSYAASSYCTSDANPIPTITGTAGGVFSISGGGSINAATGQINLASTGSGTYTITYTTTGACPATATATVTITSTANVVITAAGPFCDNESSVTLSATPPGGTWSGTGIISSTTGEFSPVLAGAGIHNITYTVGGACGGTANTNITVLASPIVSAGADTIIQEHGIIQLNGTSSVPSVTWTGPNSFIAITLDPTVSTDANVFQSGEYVISTTGSNGCTATDTVYVLVVEIDEEIWIPNIFSPNGDGNNDLFYVRGDGLNQFNLKIFNRWGEVLFEADSQQLPWNGTQNGKAVDSGVYVYMVTYVDAQGTELVISGNITVVQY
jgi:gliding motility-associated-like protein